VNVHVVIVLPLQAPPDHDVNVEPGDAAAVSVTLMPNVMFALHVVPQLMPPTFDVTVPTPEPVFVMLSACVVAANVAVTVVAAVSVTVQVPLPLQPPPDQPVNDMPLSATALSVTIVLYGYEDVQVAPQLMLPTFAVTVPVPAPAFVTVSV
jgi:hypothetical protein